MKFIRISINEFKALLNRACESYYGHKYDFEDTAAIIQWLEIHDLLGIINFLGITDVNPKKLNLTPILLKDKKKCFVFDNRVTVNHQLEQGSYDQCHACRMPITEKDKNREQYQRGVSCHYCFEKQSKEQVKRYAESERQIQLAKHRGEKHLGQPMGETIVRKRQEKLRLKEEQRKTVK